MLHFKITGQVVVLCCLCGTVQRASTVVFFDSSQVATAVDSGVTWDTISSNGYLSHTRATICSPAGSGRSIGRAVSGVSFGPRCGSAAVTVPPPGVTDYKARITLQRVDGTSST